jgi:small-conductance mechanosensitive channel
MSAATVSAAMVSAAPARSPWADAGEALTIGLRIAVILAIGLLLRLLAARLITGVVRRMQGRTVAAMAGRVGDNASRLDARAQTVSTMLGSMSTWIILTITLLMVFGELDINLGPLVAGAGVVGIALGFGAQSLVKDMLAGLFVLLEDQYGVGDIIDAGVATGTVERITLRSTQLRDLAGTMWHIPNGTIARVGNKSQSWARAVVEVVVSHTADIRQARTTLRELAEEMAGEPEWNSAMKAGAETDDQGVSALTPMGVTLRLVVDTEPKSQWLVERELRMRILETFRAQGIPLEVHHPNRFEP